MSETELVLHADDLGACQGANQGILEAFTEGLLTSTSIIANGPAFQEAVEEVLPQCSALGYGVHLNVLQGRTLRKRVSRSSSLCFADGSYRSSFVQLLLQASYPAVLLELEADFREQLDKAARYRALDHINSHLHIHAIPAIFDLVCRLAREYKIPFVRLPQEKPYVVPDLARHLSAWYSVNVAKILTLNSLAAITRSKAAHHGVQTNDWLIGVGYTGHMDRASIVAGLKVIPRSTGIVEVLLHPCRMVATKLEAYFNPSARDYALDPARSRELETLKDPGLQEILCQGKWRLNNYRGLSGWSECVNDSRSFLSNR